MINRSHLPVLILLTLILPGREATSAPMTNTVTALPQVESYAQLITAIRQTKAEGRKRVEALVEQEKVREAWEIGRLIDAHVLQHKERADYGKRVLDRLATDLEISQTELSLMLQFARAYPIYPQANKLSWSHYRELLSLDDPKEREDVAAQAQQQYWGRDRVREEVRKRQSARKPTQENIPEPVLTATPGKVGVYRMIRAKVGPFAGQLALDLGFATYYQPKEIKKFKEGDIVTVGARSPRPLKQGKQGEATSPLQLVPNITEADRYTYLAYVSEVIDGDTFKAVIDLGFNIVIEQKLRLRGLDAHEIESAEGRKAKEYLEKTLPRGLNVLIRTHRSDKYDRYLADVFVHGEYVNQKLVDEGFAVPVGNWAGE